MKQNKLLMLIAALLVAIMLVPSVSFAEDAAPATATAPTLSINKTAYTADLKGSIKNTDVDLTETIVVTPTGLPKGSTAYLYWYSTQPSVVDADGSPSIVTPAEGDPSATTFAGPQVTPKQPCDNNPVKIKADLEVIDKDGKEKTYYNAISFTVEYKKVPEGKMAFKKNKYEYKWSELFEDGGDSTPKRPKNPTKSFYDKLDYVDEAAAAIDSTYGKADATWVIEDTQYGTVDKDAWVNQGLVTFFKPGEYTLKAYPRGGGDPAVTTLSITKDPEEEEEEPEDEVIETGYTYLKFKAETITYEILPDVQYYDYDDDDVDLKRNEHRMSVFLNREADSGDYFNDDLIWSIEKNPDVAIMKNSVIHPLKVGEVVVKVRSKMFPEIYDTVTVKFVKAEEQEEEQEEVKQYDVFEFEKDEPTMLVDDKLNLLTYLKISPMLYTDNMPWVYFTSSDPTIARVNEGDAYGWLYSYGTGDAVITATAGYGKNRQTTSITVHIVEHTEPIVEYLEYENIEFDIDEYTLYLVDEYDTINAWQYLTLDPWNDGREAIIFTSTDPAVASVDEDGEITAHEAGEATITATTKHSKLSASIKINVKEKEDLPDEPIEKIEFAVDELVLYADTEFDSADLSDYMNVTPRDYEDRIIWVSSDPLIANVTYEGEIRANTAGEVTVTAKSWLGDAEGKIKIIVKEKEDLPKKPIEKIEFAVDELVLYADTEFNEDFLLYYMTWSPLDVDDDIVWVSSDTRIVDVSYILGYIRANRAGEATITAKSRFGDAEGKIKIIVKDADELPTVYTTFKFAVSELSVYEYEEGVNLWYYLALDPDNDDGNEEQVVWSSSDQEVVDVDQWGNIRRMKPGTATITAKTAVSKQEISIKITVKKDVRVPITALSFDPNARTLYEGDEAWLYEFLTITPQKHDDDYIIWTSSDETVAKVSNYYGEWVFDKPLAQVTDQEIATYKNNDDYRWDEYEDEEEVEYVRVWKHGDAGRVWALKPGTATITARSYLNPSAKATFTVTVKEDAWKTFDSISFTEASYTVKKSAETFDSLLYIVLDPIIEDVNFDGLVWTSSDETVAKVDVDNGLVTIQDFTGEKATVTISVRAFANAKATKSYELTIINDDEYFKSLTFVDSKAYTAKFVENGSFNAFLYLVQDPLPTKQNPNIFADEIIWTSSDLDTAFVTADGVVHFLKDGTVKITARSKYNEKVADTCTLTIAKNENPITAITLTQDTITLTSDAKKRVLSHYIKDYLVIKPVEFFDDDYDDDELIWTSTDPEVVDVARNGLVRDLAPGTAKLTVRSKVNAVVASFNVTVTKEPLVSIKFIDEVPTELSQSQKHINLAKYLVTEPYYYAEKYPEDLQWTSDNPRHAAVNDSGIVSWQNPGVTVTISVGDKEGKVKPATIKLTTTDVWVTGINFVKSSLDMMVGDKLALKNIDYTITPADADAVYRDSLQWSTSDPDIVGIEYDEKGKAVLKANGEGTATICAHIENAYNEAVGSFTVKVTENDIKGIKFAKKEYTKKISTNGDNYLTLYFTVSPFDAAYVKDLDPNSDDYEYRLEKLFDSLSIESSNRSVVDVTNIKWAYSTSKNMFCVEVLCEAPGTAKITITSKENEKVKAKTKVKSEGVAVKKVKMPKKSMKLYYYYNVDQEHVYQNFYKIQPKIQPSNAWYNVTWETSNAGVAFVTDNLENGEKGVWIVATGAGTATITMNVDDGTTVRQAKMKVTVLSKTVDLKLNKKKATIKMIKGKKNTLQLEAFDAETEYDVPVKWSSSNKKVATVNKDGLVTAKKAGKAVITATTKDGNSTTATCNIKVEKKKVTSLKAKGSLTMARKETTQLSVKVKPTDAYDTSLSYKSSDENVVTVDSDGLLTAVGAGEATITVKTKDGSKLKVEIDVTVTK